MPWVFGSNLQNDAALHTGATGAWVTGGPIEVGVTSEAEWWGPGQMNALVLSTNAPGIPRAAVRTVRPVSIPGGRIAWSVALGVLRESAWFDTVAANDRRSWSAAAVSFTPSGAPGLELGAARAVYATLMPDAALWARAADVFRGVSPDAGGLAADSGGALDARAQVSSLWARWREPAHGFEAYGEAGRTQFPTSWQDALRDPGHTLGYTVGLQQRVSTVDGGAWRIALEATTVEQSPSFRWRPIGSWYTSRRVLQGYTHLGRVIGAGLGPGSSGQWAAVERVLDDGRSFGGYASRRRWNADAMLALPWNVAGGQGYCEWDTGLEFGARVAQPVGSHLLSVNAGMLTRLNAFMLNGRGCGSSTGPVRDVLDLHLSVRVEPWGGAARVGTRAARHPSPPTVIGWDGAPDTPGSWTAWSKRATGYRMDDVLIGRTHVATPAGDRALRYVERWPLSVQLRYASDFPWGFHEDGVWSGRGLTIAVGGGLRGVAGPMSWQFAPQAYWAGNRPFPLQPSGAPAEPFADPVLRGWIDLPQRMGASSYTRFMPGQSEVRLRALGLTAAATSTAMWWGPAMTFPFLFSNNAEGMPRIEFGTDGARRTRFGTWTATVLWGQLAQSEWFTSTSALSRPHRFGTGLVASWRPVPTGGFEIGAGRFFHAPMPSGAIPARYWLRSFEGVLKSSLARPAGALPNDPTSTDGENQLASVFARWRPGLGPFEVYGELGREDHSQDLRDLVVAPEQQSSILLGALRSWQGTHRTWIVSGESFMAQERSLDRNRGGGTMYAHAAGSNQGHTLRGMLLGSPVGAGAGGGLHLRLAALDSQRAMSIEFLRFSRRAFRLPDGTATIGATSAIRLSHRAMTGGASRAVFLDVMAVTTPSGTSWAAAPAVRLLLW